MDEGQPEQSEQPSTFGFQIDLVVISESDSSNDDSEVVFRAAPAATVASQATEEEANICFLCANEYDQADHRRVPTKPTTIQATDKNLATKT